MIAKVHEVTSKQMNGSGLLKHKIKINLQHDPFGKILLKLHNDQICSFDFTLTNYGYKQFNAELYLQNGKCVYRDGKVRHIDISSIGNKWTLPPSKCNPDEN